ncbi:MAG: dihydroorotase [bacterium]
MGTLLKGLKIIDPAVKRPKKGDILLDGGRIAAIGKAPRGRHRVIDLDGCAALPGLIDLHAHLREPGFEYKENLVSGLRAAVRGGFTDVVCMPNTEPPVDNKSIVKYLLDRAKLIRLANLHVAGAISRGRAGEVLADIGEMAEQGIAAITDDGNSVMNARLMRRALEYSRIFGLPVMQHPEDTNLSAGGVMHEGLVSTTIGLSGIPAAAEEVIVARDIELAALTGAHLHLTHVSTAGSVELIRRAKRKKINVTCDVTPHHLALTADAVASFDTSLKINPPLRTKADIAALVRGLRDGTIDAIATDHAPHAHHEKETSFNDAPFGAIGLESALPVALTELVHKRKLPLSLIAEKMSAGPARIFNLPGGKLAVGEPANITVIDTAAEWTIDPERFASLARNCPFRGAKVKGKVRLVVVDGKIKFQEGETSD